MSESESEELSLDRFAAVRAAVAEGFSIDEVLAIEGVAAAQWDEGELAWTKRVVADEAELARFKRALDAAEDRLARKVPPIDDDAAAWLAFLEAYGAAKEPGGFLEKNAIGVNDLSRLQRTWSKRVQQDKALAKRVEQMKRKGVGPMPPLRAEKRRLRPSLAAGAARAPGRLAPNAATPARSVKAPAMSIDRYAALSAELAIPKCDKPRVLAKFLLMPEQLVALEEHFRERFAADVEAERDFSRLRAHHAARFDAMRAAAASAAPSVVPTSTRAPDSRALPVSERAPVSKPLRPDVDVRPRVAREETVVGASPFAAAALPFAPASSRGSLAATPTAVKGSGSDGHTVSVASPIAAIIEARSRAAKVVDESTYVLPDGELPKLYDDDDEEVVETAFGARAPVGEILPFAASPSSRTPTASLTPELDDDAATTMFAAADLVAAAELLSTADVIEEVSAIDDPVSLILEADEMVEDAPSSLGDVMSLERHASLCVEIAMDGAAAPALARYGVTPEAKARADAKWRDAFLRDPALRNAWNHAFEVYQSWYSQRSR